MFTTDRSTAPGVEIRHAVTRNEVSDVARWRREAGNPMPRQATRHLLGIHDARLLSTGLTRGFASTVLRRLRAPVSIPTVVAARTMALIAFVDGIPVGGLTAGPSMPLCVRLADAGHAAVLHAALSTVEVHGIAVDALWQHCGIGSTLLRRAVQICEESDVQIIYAHLDPTQPMHKRFARQHRWHISEPGTPLDLHPHTDLPALITPRTPEGSVCHLTIGDRR
ncbi:MULTISPECIES: GNAT family N-acetyltransferase [Nocardia]|uniref:GNAT family N-acetyltransferase n=1 Tax=Nocardia TaxID=1817 RepID=UPI0002DB72F8|nr:MULTISPECIES: GNAT family N-acetyltransferase [Nocardia]